MHHRPGGLLRGSLQPRLQPCSVGAGEAGCWCWGKAEAARVAPHPPEQPPGGDPAPSPHCHPLLSPPSPRGGGNGRPTAAESIGTHFPVYLREGEEGRETLLSVAIVNPNNNNKEKSLQLGAGWIWQLLLLPITIRNNYPESREGLAAKVFWIIASKWTAKY